jgi:sortase A
MPGSAGEVMGGERTVLKVGIGAMSVAAAFTLAAAVILALRDEPGRALASERVVLAAERDPVRTTRLSESPPEPEPALERRRTPPPTARFPRAAERAEEPEPKPRPEPEKEAKPEPPPRPKPESVRVPQSEPQPSPEPESRGAASRAPEPREARGEPGPAQRKKAESNRAESKKAELAVRTERSRPKADKPRRSGLPASAVMTLSIEALGLRDVPVVDSGSERALDNGVIHLPNTSLPWDDGTGGRNVYLVGHRLGYPGTGSHRIFYKLDKLRRGDDIVIEDRRGRTYQYRVTGSRVVSPRETWVKEPVPGRDMLSLQTCTPIPTFERRLIVRANRL